MRGGGIEQVQSLFLTEAQVKGGFMRGTESPPWTPPSVQVF